MITPSVGITDLSFATTHYVLEHAELARQLGIDPAKFHTGIGQDAMSVPAVDEDIVTMAATATAPILTRHGTDRVRTVLLATETGVDQAKSAGLYLHPLIGLPRNCRVVELKQACYAATAALQLAAGIVTRDPTQQVLVIATDTARYDLGTPAEATQGAAAVAMLITTDPAIARLEPHSGLYSSDVMDFWRPNYRSTAMVDGQLSVTAYLDAACEAYTDYHHQTGHGLSDFAAFCYHQPFTKMAYKAHRHLLETHDLPTDAATLDTALRDTTHYNRVIGNSYTASLYLALASLLDHADDLTDQLIALLSYGSGNVAEFFTATILPGYRDHLRTAANHDTLTRRKPIDYHDYHALHEDTPLDGYDYTVPEQTDNTYRLAAITDHKRIYTTRYTS